MIKKRRVNPHIAKNEAPIIAEKNDINRMIEKNDRRLTLLEAQLNKMMPIKTESNNCSNKD